MEKTIKIGSAVAGSIVGLLYGEWSMMLEVLLVISGLDYLTGVLASGVQGRLSSKVGAKGIAKKVMIFLIVSACHYADRAIDQENLIMAGACCFYMANELLSICENAGRAGVPVPTVLKKAIAVLNEKAEENKGDGNDGTGN